MDAAKCFYGKRKNMFLELGRQTTREERVEARGAPPRAARRAPHARVPQAPASPAPQGSDLKHYRDVQQIVDVFQPAWDDGLPLPGGVPRVYSNRGPERYTIWKEYPFEASSEGGFFSDLGTVERSYTPRKFPAAVLGSSRTTAPRWRRRPTFSRTSRRTLRLCT